MKKEYFVPEVEIDNIIALDVLTESGFQYPDEWDLGLGGLE